MLDSIESLTTSVTSDDGDKRVVVSTAFAP